MSGVITERRQKVGWPGSSPPVASPAELTEDGVALAFAAEHGSSLLFDHDAGRWFAWDGSRWAADGTGLAFNFARLEARHAARFGERKFSTALGKANFAAGVERFARADPVHAVTAKTWDRDGYLLGTPGGTVDLRTGAIRPPSPDDRMTRTTSCAPGRGDPERWLAFLAETLHGDAEAIRFLQQWSGYCLTGDTREHALLFAHGPGGNGKGVFTNTLVAILADYATTASMDTFTASRHSQHPADLAMLAGARLVTASETEEGRAWAEARIKSLTGGDPITARFMRRDFFTFHPQFKLLIVGNHAPRLNNIDEAMRRRLNVVPFTATPQCRDPQLEAKLKSEHPQILRWMIEGCLDWQRHSLARPEIVKAATAEYFEGQDLFGQWLNDQCETATHLWDLPARLFSSWSAYAHRAGDVPGSIVTFADRLQSRGFIKAKTAGNRVYRGLMLKQHAGEACDG